MSRALAPPAGPLPHVKLIGLGGVGGTVARYGALYLASLEQEARLVLIDGDAFEPSNASRMYFADEGNKARVVREDLARSFAGSRLSLEAIEAYVDPGNVERLVREGDVVLLAVDNHATRKLVGEFCAAARRDVCLISGGNDGVGEDADGRRLRGTAGNCQIHVRRGGEDATPALGAFHPEIASPRDALPAERSCAELLGEGVPQIAFANLMVASAMLNTLWLYLCGGLHYDELAFDLAEGLMRPLRLPGAGGRPRGR